MSPACGHPGQASLVPPVAAQRYAAGALRVSAEKVTASASRQVLEWCLVQLSRRWLAVNRALSGGIVLKSVWWIKGLGARGGAVYCGRLHP